MTTWPLRCGTGLLTLFFLVGAQPVEGQERSESERSLSPEISQEESKALAKVLDASASAQQRLQAAHEFLKTYPESQTAPLVTRTLALTYHAVNDRDNFLKYGERVLEAAPDDPVILALLASTYADMGEGDKASRYGEDALNVVEQATPPSHASLLSWEKQKSDLRANAFYAIGTAKLQEWESQGNAANSPLFVQAVAALEQSSYFDPRFQFAYYRIARAYGQCAKWESALESYAMAAAIDSSVTDGIKNEMKAVHSAIAKAREIQSLNGILESGKAHLQQKTREFEERLLKAASGFAETESQNKSGHPQP